ALTLLAAPAGAETPVDAAAKLLASKDYTQRLQALEQLAAIGRNAAAEKAVIGALSDEDWGVEIAACKVLAKIGADPAKDALAKRALDGEIQWVRDAAIDALKT